jgi:hypothetical protein
MGSVTGTESVSTVYCFTETNLGFSGNTKRKLTREVVFVTPVEVHCEAPVLECKLTDSRSSESVVCEAFHSERRVCSLRLVWVSEYELQTGV